MTDHTTCCCTETLDDLRALNAAYKAARWEAAGDRVVLTCRLNQAIAERDRLNQVLTNYLALRSAYLAANCDRDELTNALAAAIAERDQARDTAARLEAELARGFRTAAPDITLTLYPPVSGPRTPVLLTEKK